MDSIVIDNRRCLEQGIAFLRSISRDVYARRCPSCFDSSMGGHIRHNIDHFKSFLKGYRSGSIDYDARERDSVIEADPEHAADVLDEIARALDKLETEHLDAAVSVRMDGGGESQWSESSVRRELQFLLSHTIHHYALIVAIGGAFDISEYPENFGVAPSTVKHQKRA